MLGRRQSDKCVGDFFRVDGSQVWTMAQHKAERQPSGKFEVVSSKGRRISAAETNRRAQVGAERFPLSEAEIIKHPVVIRRMRGTLARLARQNKIDARYVVTASGLLDSLDMDAMELYSEYLITLLQSFRRETSKAPLADLDIARDYLAGIADDSRVFDTLFRDSETAAIRYLKKRQAEHRSLAEAERQGYRHLTDNDVFKKIATPLQDDLHQWVQDKSDIACALRRLRVESRFATKIVMWSFALGRATTCQSNKNIARSLEQTTGEHWDSAKVANVLESGLRSLRGYLC